MFANSNFKQNLDDWTPKKLENKDAIFEGSQLEKSDNLPYWANLNIEFLAQAINAYWLQKNLTEKLGCAPTKEPIIKI